MIITLPKELIKIVAEYVFAREDFNSLAAFLRVCKCIYKTLDPSWLKQQAPFFLWMRPQNNGSWTPTENDNMKAKCLELIRKNYPELKKHMVSLNAQLQEQPQDPETILTQYYIPRQEKSGFHKKTWLTEKNFFRLSFYIGTLSVAFVYFHHQWYGFHWHNKLNFYAPLLPPLMALIHSAAHLEMNGPVMTGTNYLNAGPSAEAYQQYVDMGFWLAAWTGIMVAIFLSGIIAAFCPNATIVSFANAATVLLFSLPLMIQIGCSLPQFEKKALPLAIEKVLLSALPVTEKSAGLRLKNSSPAFRGKNIETIGEMINILKKEGQVLPRLTLWGATLQGKKEADWQSADKEKMQAFLVKISAFNHTVERTFHSQ